MRRFVVWLFIAVLWLIISVLVALRQGWKQAWLQALIALLFFSAALYFRYKDRIRS